MSETFSKIQNALRALKDHGIDYTVPHGISIVGKTYPSLNKSIVFDNDWEYTGSTFQIPLENRHTVTATHSFNLEKEPYLMTNVYYPTQHGGWFLDDMRKWGVIQHLPPYDTVDDKLKEFSSEKSRGIRVSNYGYTVENVPDDELQEHYKIGKAARQARIEAYPLEAHVEHPRVPTLIKVHKSVRNGDGFTWLYDVKTEQLRAWTPIET